MKFFTVNRSATSALPTSSRSSIASSREAALTAEKSPSCQRQMNKGIDHSRWNYRATQRLVPIPGHTQSDLGKLGGRQEVTHGVSLQTALNLDPFMIHETFLCLTETAFGSHPCRVVSVTYRKLRPFHGGSLRGRDQGSKRVR